jgi:hypothetical protein
MNELWWSVAAQTGIVSRTRQLLFVVPGGRNTLVWVAAGVVALAVVAGALLLWWRRRRDVEREQARVPPLVFPAAPASRPRTIRRAEMAPPAPGPAPEALAAVAVQTPPPQPAGNGASDAAKRPAPDAMPSLPPAPPVAPSLAPGDSLVDGKTVRFYKPSDGTLQILPGRLEIVDGADQGQSIRFVQTGSSADVTFGRSDGPPYRHIQLRAPTVSRQHARMCFEQSTWSILNLSRTNPVVVNGEELDLRGDARRLQDGDRIEMGEVTFLFRER